jgi:hypothetical protein
MEKATVGNKPVEDVENDPAIPPISSIKRQREEDDDPNKVEADGKRSKLEESSELKNGADEKPAAKGLEPKTAISQTVTRSRSNSINTKDTLDDTAASVSSDNDVSPKEPAAVALPSGKRWRTHQMAEDYIDSVAKLMYPATKFRPYGYDTDIREYPLEHISVLNFIKSPLRRPTIIERWSPYEITCFEGAMMHYGKEFHLVSRAIESKSTKEVIDFYYVWKKTAHYKRWKERYMTDLELEDLEYEILGK